VASDPDVDAIMVVGWCDREGITSHDDGQPSIV
jgi:hypothetical protein